MSVKVLFECDGCEAKTEGTDWLHSRFISVSGRSYGIGSRHTDKAADVAPEGWVAFDPYTGATYCPDCWASIIKESA